MPEWVSPMLAVLTDQPFSDPRWIFERKLDGERCLAFRKGGQVRLMSRNRLVVSIAALAAVLLLVVGLFAVQRLLRKEALRRARAGETAGS